MKKIYKNPEIDVVVLKPMQLLAGSEQLGVNGDYDGTITIAGRQSDSDWDDDEEY